MGVLYDIQGIQSRAHSERGIARYLLESAAALERWHSGAVSTYLLNSDLEVPASVDPLTSSGRLQRTARLQTGGVDVYHAGSPIELDVPLHKALAKISPRAGLRLATTLYDLIPQLFPDLYLKESVH